MFDIGFLEMTTIGIVALVVIGPERLPEVAAKVGRYVGKAQRFVRGVRSDISRELETGDLKKLLGDQKSQIDELRNMVHTATNDMKSSTSDVFKDAENSIGNLKSEVTGSQSESRADAIKADEVSTESTHVESTPAEPKPVEPKPAQSSQPESASLTGGDDSQSHSNKTT